MDFSIMINVYEFQEFIKLPPRSESNEVSATYTLVLYFNPILAGGGHWMAPPSKIGFYASGNEFWVTPNGWQFLSTYIFEDSFCFWDKNDLENVLEYHIWGKGQFLKILRRNKTFISEATELSEGWRHGF